MGDILDFLNSGSVASITLIILIVIIVIAAIVYFFAALFLGRRVRIGKTGIEINQDEGSLRNISQARKSEKRSIDKLRAALNQGVEKGTIDDQVNDIVINRLATKFSTYSDYILIRYGSSVRFATKRPKDFDYIVFLIGYDKAESRKEYNEGTLISSTDSKFSVDIHYKDYNSFSFALISGLPYEHGIMYKYKYIAGNQGYLRWLKTLSENIRLDRDYIVESLIERLDTYKTIIDNDLAQECSYATIVALYSLATTLIQITYCRILPKVCGTKNISPIAFPENMLAVIADNDFKSAFDKVYSLFKRDLSEEYICKQDLVEFYSVISTYAEGVV